MRYGTAKYGTFKYGPFPIHPHLLWGIDIDWDGDGNWSGENEAEHVFGLSCWRGRDFLVASNGEGFEPMGIGEMTLKVRNDDGRYDPYNADGPLYGLLFPGKKVRVRVKDSSAGATGVTYNIFAGRLKNIIPYGRRGTSELVVTEDWDMLAQADAAVRLQSGIRTDQAMLEILSKVGWLTEWPVALDISSDHIPYWWEKKGKAKPKLEELSSSSLGSVFVAGDGTFTFYSRHHPINPENTITEKQVLKDIAIPQPWENVRNRITVQTHPQVVQNFGILWSLEETLWISAGQEIMMEVYYTHDNANVPATGVIPPEPYIDYYFSDVLGVHRPEQAQVHTEDLRVKFWENGTSAILTLTNTAAYGGYLVFMRVRGYPIASPNVLSSLSDVGDYAIRPRSFRLDSTWLQSKYLSDDFADFLGTHLYTKMKYPVAVIEARPDLQFALELFDIFWLDWTTWGISERFQVVRVEHEWLEETGQLTRTKVNFEPIKIVGLPPWKMGESALGTTTRIGW
jgi:hypothetical protein